MIGVVAGLILSLIYIYPVFQGLILLPLDLLVSNSAPWFLASQILIKNSYMLDSIIQMFPWRHMTFASLMSGILPLWNPYQFAGLPFMASMKPMVFYPFNLLFPLGEVNAWNALLFSQLFFAFLFMYLLSGKLGMRIWGRTLASVSFAFSSLMVGFLQFGSDGHALIWTPLFLWSAFSFIDSHKFRYLICLSVSIAFAVFAGHLQFFGYQSILLAVFTVWYVRSVGKQWTDILYIGLASLIGIGIAGIQLLPGIELFRHSFRGSVDTKIFASGIMRPEYLLRLFSPDFFGSPITKDLHIGYIETSGYFGLVPLFFVFLSLSLWKDNKFVRFFAVVMFTAVVFSFDGPATLLHYLHIPLITSGWGGRIFSVVMFCGPLLAGFGLEQLLTEGSIQKRFRTMVVYCGLVLIILTGGLIINRYAFFGATMTNLKFSFLIAGAFLGMTVFMRCMEKRIPKAMLLFGIGICALTYFDLFRMGYRFLTYSNTKFLYPEIPVVSFVKSQTDTTLERVYGLTGSEVPSVLKVYSVETYNPLYPMRQGIVLKALEGKTEKDLPSNVFLFSPSKELKYVLDVMGVAYIAVQNDQDPSIGYFLTPDFQKDMTKVYSDERHDVYQNKAAYPRFGVFYSVKQGLPENAILADLRGRSTDLSQTLLLEESLPYALTEGSGSATLVASNLNSQSFTVKSSKPGLFYISDTYFPGWEARVNGTISHLYRANYNFRAVLVPEGESTVEFRYVPNSYALGRKISIGSLLALLLLWGGHRVASQKGIQREDHKPRKSKNK